LIRGDAAIWRSLSANKPCWLQRWNSWAERGFDSDNHSVFKNETVRDYCQAENIRFTRCRPYRKNAQAFEA